MKRILIPLLICGLFACSKKDTEKPTPTEQPAAVAEITTYLESVDSLSEFAIAFKRITISTADASGGLTVFAPGNTSIGSYNPGGRTTGNDLPDSVVKDHIVKGKFKAADLTNGKKLTTLSGKELTVTVVGGHLYINNIELTFTDGAAGAQMVHVIFGMLSKAPGSANITVYDATQWSVDHRNGLPATGAKVMLYLNSLAYSSGTPAYTATTDSNGVAHFTGLPAINYIVVVKKGTLSNVWPDVNGHTMVAYDSLFQSTEEINAAPHQSGTVPGDFRFHDLNQDGVINANDKADGPLRRISFMEDTVITDKLLIGYQENHMLKAFKTADEAMSTLPSIAMEIGYQHKQLVMVDGFMSDDTDCTGFASWCAFDNFTFTASNNTIAAIWDGMYTSIGKLNRIIYSLPTMTGDTTVLAAQARGLRAFAYLELTPYFGDLPVYKDLVMPADISRSSVFNNYQIIINEFEIALPSLPVIAPVANFHHLTLGAGTALLARAFTLSSNFSGGRALAVRVINSGTYALSTDTSEIFANVNGSEIIWDLSSSYPTNFYEYFNQRSFCPVIRLSEMYLNIGESWIGLNEYSRTSAYINPIRIRNGLDTLPLTNDEDALAAVVGAFKADYKKEGFRFRNLVRWEMAEATLGNKGYQSHHSKLPIPTNVLQQYPNIVQNVGY